MRIFTNQHASRDAVHSKRLAGFSLIELMVATAVFLVLSAGIFDLFSANAPYFSRQQNLAAVNIAIQNVVAQMQLDLVNAGTGYYPGSVISSWPIGVTIVNQPSGAPNCDIPATFTYTAACFDTLNILTINPNIPPAHPTNSTGGTASTSCSNVGASPFYIQPNAGQTAAQTAAGFNIGDQVMLITTGGGTHSTTGPTGGNTSNASSGTLVNSIVINGTPTAGANFVALPFAAISAASYTAGNYSTGDSLNISNADSTNLGGAFCAADWVMKLEPTKYTVDVSDAQNPKLTRKQNGNTDVIAEQIIGFKVGAATWNSTLDTSTPTYSFYASNAMGATPPTPPGYGSNFQLVRSVRVTLVGRTNPEPGPSYTFKNTFDGGPYQVVGATIVINPRNLTMNGN